MPEMWAQCSPCNRWFYVPFSTGEEMAAAQCPVCASAPDSFEVRTGATQFHVDLSAGEETAQAV